MSLCAERTGGGFVCRLFLLANIVAVLVIIVFGTAFYFPSIAPENAVVRQALTQSDRGIRGGAGGDQEQQVATAQLVAFEFPHGEEEATESGPEQQQPRETELESATLAEASTEPEPTPAAEALDADPTTVVASELSGGNKALDKDTNGATTTAVAPTLNEIRDETIATRPAPAPMQERANRIAGLIAQMKEKALRGVSTLPDTGGDEVARTVETLDRDAKRETEPHANELEQQQQQDDDDGTDRATTNSLHSPL